MSKASTQIADLPDNDASPDILKQLNEDIGAPSDSEKSVSFKETPVSPLYDIEKMTIIAKEAGLVFALVFGLSNKYVILGLSKIPGLKGYDHNSLIFNVIISIVIALLYFAIKYIMV